MFTIRQHQTDTLNHKIRVAFEAEMVTHSKWFAPRLCKVIGDDQLRIALRGAIDRAGLYGFTNRGPVRLFIELMLLYGSAFDTDPQYPWAKKELKSLRGQLYRAQRLHESNLAYQEQVSGPVAGNTRAALERLLVLAHQNRVFKLASLESEMLIEIGHIFPEKATYIGEARLRSLIHEGSNEASKYSLPVRGSVLLITLMLAFGHGCIGDPLYPWISRTLNDPRIVDARARSARLEKKATTWLRYALDKPHDRETP